MLDFIIISVFVVIAVVAIVRLVRSREWMLLTIGVIFPIALPIILFVESDDR